MSSLRDVDTLSPGLASTAYAGHARAHVVGHDESGHLVVQELRVAVADQRHDAREDGYAGIQGRLV